jgi:hypothetical protein
MDEKYPGYPRKCNRCEEIVDFPGYVSTCEVCKKEGCIDCSEIPFISSGCSETGGDIDMYFCVDCYNKFCRVFPHWNEDQHECLSMKGWENLTDYIVSSIHKNQ